MFHLRTGHYLGDLDLSHLLVSNKEDEKMPYFGTLCVHRNFSTSFV